MISTSLKLNLTTPYSNVNEAGRKVLNHALLKGCVEYNARGNWMHKPNNDATWNDDVVYRITEEYNG